MGTCQACNILGKEGTCSLIPKGQDPDKECPGVAACGKDVCDGKGACLAALPTTTVCRISCSATEQGLLLEHRCDGKGSCAAAGATKEVCAPYRCVNGSGGSVAGCKVGCADSSDCVPGSACDRISAHTMGTGKCVATSNVKVVTTSAELQDTVVKIINGFIPHDYVLVSAGTYPVALVVNKNTVSIIGMGPGKTILTPSGNNSPVYVGSGASLTLQAVKVRGSKAEGILCDASNGTFAALTLLDSEISSNASAGVRTKSCYVTFQRNTIKNNKWGGLDLKVGSMTLLNNLVTGNGTAGTGGSPLGGIRLGQDSPGFKVHVLNNTVVNNLAIMDKHRGVSCSKIGTGMFNNVIWNGGGAGITSGCYLEHSVVQGYPGGKGNISTDPQLKSDFRPRLSPQSPCINAGVATNWTVMDLPGNPRPKVAGGKVDIGAFEVK